MVVGKKIKLDLNLLLSYNILMKNYRKKPWSYKERMLLRDHYYFMGGEEMQNILPGRTHNSIVKQVAYLKARGWWFKKP